jgi:hypothetical protein
MNTRLNICGIVAALFASAGSAAHANIPEPMIADLGIDEVIVAETNSVNPSADRRIEILKSGAVKLNGKLTDLSRLDNFDAVVSDALSSAYGGMSMSRVRSIKNAPYSAEVISERLQSLPDGNVIETRNTSAVYRDSAGRTRQETRDKTGTTSRIIIHDSIEGAHYTLNPQSKTATKAGISANLQKRISELRERAQTMSAKHNRGGGVNAGPFEEIVVKRIESGDGQNQKNISEEVSVNVIRLNELDSLTALAGKSADPRSTHFSFSTGDKSMADSMLSNFFSSGPISTSWKDYAWQSKATTKEIGSKDFDGVRATGTLKSYTIPAGEVGNRNPITVTTESWYSPELQVTVYSKTSDPRSGDSIYRLANIRRNEQPMSLFAVPSDYTLKGSGLAKVLPPK